MKRLIHCTVVILLGITLLSSCNEYNQLMKSTDYNYKYEVAKSYYAQGHYNKAAYLLANTIMALKGTDKGEESLMLLGESALKSKNYEQAAEYFKKYYESYPRGIYAQRAKYEAGMSLYNRVPDPRLDQERTYEAMAQFQSFLEAYPNSSMAEEARRRIFELQDLLVEKQYLAAKLYYDLGDYIGNGLNGNYLACIMTAENAIKEFPYSKKREDFALLILKAKFDYAKISIESKKAERYADAIDEYYGYINEYPESKHLAEIKKILDSTPKQFIHSDEK